MTYKIKEFFLITFAAFKEMPSFLMFITIYCLSGIVLIIVLLIPTFSYEIAGEEVTLVQFWADGIGFIMFITGIQLIISAIGFIKRFKWARIVFLSFLPMQSLISAIMQRETMESLIGDFLFYLILFLPIFGWYLFGKKTVKEYFK